MPGKTAMFNAVASPRLTVGRDRTIHGKHVGRRRRAESTGPLKDACGSLRQHGAVSFDASGAVIDGAVAIVAVSARGTWGSRVELSRLGQAACRSYR